ncbi:GGDEF domain-containing protein [Mesoterricola sediminis]|uniref:GGDEF domain-containing protein n=1 Tax=Mesoterricola sediminis TaxID=2927980 RepID=A0AA48GYW4_9BACT|nr:GGDEF domain-containing protein [Mesoterricola sediminis]BDU76950.1 GGDEF domain-containing protein [Mesoterricola sediminis]
MVPLSSLSHAAARRQAPAASQEEAGRGLADLGAALRGILGEDRLKPAFQPIVDLATGEIHAFEGLIRGPSDSLLQSPASLFKVAGLTGQLFDLERACCRTLATAFAASGAPWKLFLNLSPGSLTASVQRALVPLRRLEELGLDPGRIVIELTEALPVQDLGDLARAIGVFRQMGFAIALDDLGEGFSSLRLWSELRPEYVKVDMHFIQGVSRDPVKHQFLRSLCDIAAKTGARVVGEGVEFEADFAVIQELGLPFGQGYLFGRPEPEPVPRTPAHLFRRRGRVQDGSAWLRDAGGTAARLTLDIAPVDPGTPNLAIERRFLEDRELQSIPVVRDGVPVGLINRHVFMDLLFRPFSREIHGKRPVESLMDRNILVLDHRTSLHDLSRLIVESDRRHILHGFILTRDGVYAGMGSGHDLMREITQMQIRSARYANPLTGLPGNVPINEHLDDLLRQGLPFTAAYCDLDHFKPYNDVYGYREGDEVIHWTGELLSSACRPDLDFVGHVGGDDFILVFRSPDWRERCEGLLAAFEAGRTRFFGAADLARGGYLGEDRRHQPVLHPLVSLSIGAVEVRPGAFHTHHEVAAAAAVAKKEAKRLEGSSLFVERRAPVTGFFQERCGTQSA